MKKSQSHSFKFFNEQENFLKNKIYVMSLVSNRMTKVQSPGYKRVP